MKKANDVSTQETVRHPASQGARQPSLVLVLVNDAGVRVTPLPERGSMTIGRGQVDLKLADDRVSRAHVRIHVGPRLRVEDLGSANGTFVGGERLAGGEVRAIDPGAVVEIGRTLLIVRRRDAVDATKPTGAAGDVEVGEAMRRAVDVAERAAASNLAVLLLGETGVGKDVLAERIHKASPRAGAPFLRLNCAAFSANLLESELFGHEKGAFTGATAAKVGLLESADGGTVFLDEIADLPLELQAKLLIVIERCEVMAVGAVRPRPIDVRFVSATNRDLQREVAVGAFRRDLYYRLNAITVAIPPLRSRGSEIEGLARLFAREAARTMGRGPSELSPEAVERLRAHPWPGNVRELRAVIERAVLLAEGSALGRDDLHLPPAGEGEDAPWPEGSSERERVTAALARCGGNQSRAARALGVSRNTLIARIAEYGLARPLARPAPRRGEGVAASGGY